VRNRDRVYEINASESRMLATIGAFRVVAESDLHDLREDAQSSRRRLKHLEKEGLIRPTPLSAEDRAVTLTDRGRDLLDANRYERDGRLHESRQTFYAGVRKPRELTHDAKVYRAYQRAEDDLCSAPCKARRFAPPAPTRGLRALTVPARRSGPGNYVMVGGVMTLSWTDLGR
jgi:hypothetical protein